MNQIDSPVQAEMLFVGGGDMAALVRAKDWSDTPLGPKDRWPRSLRTIIRVMLTSRYAMWLGWGPELTFFYNDAYARMSLGKKHPWALGQPARRVWEEIWPDLEPRVETVLRTGEATWDEGLLLFLERSGFTEETYHTFSYSPLPDDTGATAGLFCVVTEETERRIAERRLALLRELASRLTAPSSQDAVLDAVTACLGADARDLPFSLHYSFDPCDGSRPRIARLVGRTGLPADHPGAPATIALDGALEGKLVGDSPAAWPLALVAEKNAPVEVALPGAPSWPAGPWKRPPQSALLLPIARSGHPELAGVFVAGLNPHRPLDAAYRDFLGLFVGQIAAGLGSASAIEEERRRVEALAELDRAKTTFFSNVSHEFRTPITLMLGPLQELVEEPGRGDEERQRLSLVHRNGVRLLKLVNAMLDFSRLEAGRLKAKFEPVDLAQLTRELASNFESATSKAGLAFTIECAPLGEPAFVDPDLWEKIVLNLVSNAFKFTLAGAITVSLERAGREARLVVADTGSGIPADELPRIFQRFHRVEGTKGRAHEGTGIGLALVQELVKLHGGQVTVASEEGRGTRFTVTLPLGSAHLPADRVSPTPRKEVGPASRAFVDEALRWLPEPAATTTPRDPLTQVEPSPTDSLRRPVLSREPAPATLLLADDNADMRDYLKRVLSSRWRVETVANGREALEAIRRRRPDLLVTDVMMPELDGFGLVRALREDEALRSLPVIMLSARAGEDARAEGLEAGATDYLVKPFSPRELLARVESQLLRARMRAVEDAHAEQLASVFAHAPLAIALVHGPDHVFEIANPLGLDLVGGRPVVGKPIREAVPELVGQGIFELLDGVRATGKPYVGRSHAVTLQRQPGTPTEEVFFDFVCQPIPGRDGAADRIAIVAYDVSELARARRDAETANRTKDEFLAMLGHELRNPLAPIVTAVQLMRLRSRSEVGRELAIVERQVKHLVGLVDDLLDVSRITRGKVQLRTERVELAEVVARAIEMASPLLEQQRHELRLDVAREGLAVEGDPGRLAQVVANLLTNAAKYSQPGGRVSIAGALERTSSGAEVVLRVADTGIGIERDMLPRIFEPFLQSRQSLDRARGGLGLGLAIARSLVALHGGTISAASDGPGKGAELTVRLPAAAVREARASEGGEPGIAPPPHLARDGRKKVLVVDDNVDAAKTLADVLEIFGFTTATAHDGPTALRVAQGFAPDVALLDIGLPVMDGYELARRFRDDARLRSVPLIALTGYGQEQDRTRSADVGFAVHLVKPLSVEELQATLERVAGPLPR